MARRPITTDEVLQDVHFPKAGVDTSQGFGRQPARPAGKDGEYARTCREGVNVRAFDSNDRMRGGSRPGLSKFVGAPVVADWIVQDLRLLVGEGYDPPGGGMPQSSLSGRVVTLVAVSQGEVYVVNPGDTAWTKATNNTGETPPLNASGVMFSSPNNQKLYFADGVNWAYYDPHTNSVETWAATAGALPVDTDNNKPRLITTWRGRTVLSGLVLDPQNWFMSAVSDPTDFDYSPVSTTPTQAIAGNNAPLGFIGDVVTCLVPYTDDVLVFGGDHSIYLLRGDPMAGGQLDLVTDAIGMAFGEPYCKDPYGTVYFFSNRTGIYTLVPGQQPVRISQAIESELAGIDTGANSIRLLWNDRWQGVHVFVTPLSAPAATTHFFYETRSGAWWTDTFADHNFDPIACCTFDGNSPTDRVPLIGSWDGYVRAISPTATTDDGEAIASSVVLGPLLTKDLDELLLKDLQAVLGTASGSVTFAVHVGATAEAALSSTAVVTGTWGAGRNLSNLVRRAGHAVYVRLTSTSAWSMEAVRARIAAQGKVRRRGV